MGFVLKHKWLCYHGGLETFEPRIDSESFPMRALPANMAHPPDIGLMLANVADVGLTLKQHWINVLFE